MNMRWVLALMTLLAILAVLGSYTLSTRTSNTARDPEALLNVFGDYDIFIKYNYDYRPNYTLGEKHH